MRRVALVGTMVTFAALIFALLQATSVGANSAGVPVLQETATATADVDTTATAGVDTTVTAGADTTATADVDTTATADADMTATAGADVTTTADMSAITVTPETAGTAAADTTATATSFGQLPGAGASSGPNSTLLVLGALLLLFGAFAVFSMLASRRNV